MSAFEERSQDIPQFGVLLDGLDYRPRPGAYGVALDQAGKVLAIEVDSGAFFPGGGLDDGESDQQGLRREVLEETGFEIEIGARLGVAKQFVVSEREAKAFNKIGAFFLIELRRRVRAPSEPDHVTLWLTVEEAMARLRDENHRWALARAVAGKKPDLAKEDREAKRSGR